ncbi:DUF1048 domain-containing protein [Clostridium botulinum]|uniref:DUF1048 domain-containing protein n=1 Tax=Clostridium botulinum TaxID=1491 RepID=UPI00016BA129|nr:DUF1048 domain-containing protein [Clostridium botulinum]APC85726.1 hypothetical protein NPD12_251 [Clostridium botulinum]AXG96540.1 DUF1048 domain-containing protein [Clostridium botulinum]EDT83098.1 conserved hypothetical protein [Clostridium botulinum NCTC 2916]MBY6772332.1 DUF1048 domain-containing protein [Clostridium botulinum]MBY6775833.1 DUF1048 domain-containing protein [Clostridium botulinum]
MNNIKELVKSTNELSKSLNDANDETFTNIACYLRASSLSESQCEESIHEILAMFLTAENNNESIENIIGNDSQKFCDEIIESYATKKFSKENVIVNLKIILNCFFILWSINIVFNYIPNMIKSKSLLLNYNFSLPFIINTVLITFLSFAVFNYIGKTAFKEESNKIFVIKFILLYIIFMIISVFTWKKLIKIILFTTKIHYVLIFIAISYLILFLLSQYTYKQK